MYCLIMAVRPTTVCCGDEGRHPSVFDETDHRERREHAAAIAGTRLARELVHVVRRPNAGILSTGSEGV